MSKAMALSFNNVQFDTVDQSGHPWLQARQIGEALGYSRPETVFRIYERNKDEFTEKMTCIVNLTMQGQGRSVRIFSLRGAHLIAMFSRTRVAKDFRKWVLDILDRYVNGAAEPKIPIATPSTSEDRKPLRDVVNVWNRVTGLPHSDVWKQVRAAFNLNNIKEMPKEWIPDACKWVQERIDNAPKTLPEPNKPVVQDPLFYDQIMSNIYHSGLKFCGEIQDEAEKVTGGRHTRKTRPSDRDYFYRAHARQIQETTEGIMRQIHVAMRSVEAIKHAERMLER